MKKVSGDFDSSYTYNSGGDRYLYGASFGKDGLRIFDCKKDKFIRTISTASAQGSAIDGGRLYYLVTNGEKDYTKIYSASRSGADRKLVLEGMPYNTTVHLLSKDCICYHSIAVRSDGSDEMVCHIYTTATGEDRVVDLDTFYDYIRNNPHGANIYTGSGILRG